METVSTAGAPAASATTEEYLETIYKLFVTLSDAPTARSALAPLSVA